jgi:hypothetical protein
MRGFRAAHRIDSEALAPARAKSGNSVGRHDASASVSGRMTEIALRTDGYQRKRLDEEQAIAISKVNTTTHLALQHNQLMSERGILRLKSAPSRRNGALSDGGSFTPN